MYLCLYEPIHIPKQYGMDGRSQSQEEIGEHIYGGIEKELDGLASCPGCELHLCTPSPSSTGSEHCFTGVELLFELCE